MLTIAQASVLGQNQVRDGIIEMFVEESPLLQYLPFIPVTGNAYQYRRELTLPTAATRAVNATWVESTGTFESKLEALKIYGGEAHVDRFIQKTMGGTLGDHVANQSRLKVKSVRDLLHNDFINGDVAVNPDGMDGIKKRVPAGQIIGPATALDVNLDEASRNTFLDYLDELISKVPGGASALFMNASMKNKVKSVARRAGFADKTTNGFGQTVDSYGDVPLIDIGKRASGAEIITNIEPSGDATPATNTTSIYAVNFSTDTLAGLTNGGIDAYEIGAGPDGEMETKPAFGIRIESYMGLVDHNDKAIARLRRIR